MIGHWARTHWNTNTHSQPIHPGIHPLILMDPINCWDLEFRNIWESLWLAERYILLTYSLQRTADLTRSHKLERDEGCCCREDAVENESDLAGNWCWWWTHSSQCLMNPIVHSRARARIGSYFIFTISWVLNSDVGVSFGLIPLDWICGKSCI